ncbi:hypothetical protein [Gynuella sp.]|uniref:hypothetical protein n=1 Tax=Gynuella sp. TaxID=2969146 RepID=UPI003D0D8EEF
MKTIRHSASFDISQSIDQLFPLFSPEGETKWVPGWEYTNVMGTTKLSEDYVFITGHHDHKANDAIWIVKRYDLRKHHVQFYKIEPGDKVGIVTVDCTELPLNHTRVEVGYEYIALGESGETFIAEFTQEVYDEFIDEWKTLLTRYFKQHTL